MNTGIPLIADVDRSAAITQADPRRNENGDAAMRPIRNGISSVCRPLLFLAISSSGLGRPFGGIHSAWDSRETERRRSLPAACRFSQGTILLPISSFGSRLRFALGMVPSPNVDPFLVPLFWSFQP